MRLRIGLSSAAYARDTGALAGGASESATAHLSPETSAERLDHSHADTILTSEMESPFAPGRETSAQPGRPDTSGGARHGDGGRKTVVAHAADTQTDAGSWQQEARGEAVRPSETRQGVAETRAASEGGAAAQSGRVVTAPVPRRSLAPLVVGGALALLLVAGGVGFLAWRSARGARGVVTQPPADAHPPPPAAPKAEAGSFWFEAFDKPEDDAGKRVAEPAATLVSGQRFRFHFMPKERGYLYIIGPGAGGNAQVTLLTGQGAGPLKSNLAPADADFAFPSWTKLKLDDTPCTDDFTFIFSPTPLMSPAFLAGKYMHELSPVEVKELEDFRAQFRSDAPQVAAAGEGDDRRVAVSAPQPATNAGKPVIFEVRINHR